MFKPNQKMSLFEKTARRLARITTSGRYIPEIDGLRFLAILSVILFHVYLYVNGNIITFGATPKNNIFLRMLHNGGIGVSLFFVISGFVIALPFASRYLKGTSKVKLTHYYFRRLTRIEPPYFVCMLLFFLVLLLNGKHELKNLLLHLGASLVYLHNLIYEKMSLINPIAWSLEIEIQFYIFAPLLCSVFSLGRPMRRGIIIFSMVAFAFLQSHFNMFLFSQWCLLGQIQYFLAGFLFADIYLTELGDKPNNTKIWDLIGILAMIAVFILGLRMNIAKFLLPLLILILYYSVFRGYVLKLFFSNPLTRTIGGMCYSLYLLHYGIIALMGLSTKGLAVSKDATVNFVLLMLVFFSAILLIGTIYFALVERPCMNTKWPQVLSERFGFKSAL